MCCYHSCKRKATHNIVDFGFRYPYCRSHAMYTLMLLVFTHGAGCGVEVI